MKDRAMTALQKTLSRTLAAFAVMSVCALGFGYTNAFAAKGDLEVIRTGAKTEAPMRITLGKADIVNLPAGVSDVLVANPSIVDVQAVQSNRLYIVGLAIGDTNIIVLDAQGNVVKRMDVHVSYDLQAIQSLVDGLFPNESVRVGSIHDQVILTGRASNPEVASKISSLVAHYVSDLQDTDGSIDELISNLIEVQGEQQVMLQVKIVEAERSVIKEFGVDFRANDPNELAATTLFGTTPLSNLGNSGFNGIGVAGGQGLASSQDPAGLFRGFFDTKANGIGVLGVFLSALEDENLINVLAEPNLTAVSGQQAGFLAGGEFPVPTGRDQFGNITIEFREFGVSLNFKPVVLSDDRISLNMNTEVSSLDNANAVTLADVTVPGLDIRRAETTIEIPSGGSLMIAGLLQSKTAKGLSGLPGIKDTPILGDLISSDSFQRDESELVVIVTAYLVEPYADEGKSDKSPKRKQTQLAKIFSTNLRRMFDMDDEVFADAGTYGYIVD